MRVIKLHNLHKNLEWSGKLLYIKNSFDWSKGNDIVVETLDFIPWDLGSAAFTSIDYTNPKLTVKTEEYIPDLWSDERVENDNLHVQNGIIHSHHNMQTFFSSTDQPTLIEKSQAFPYGMYLSLIVNHDITWSSKANRWKARIAWHSFKNREDVWVIRVGNETIPCYQNLCLWAECDVMFKFEVDKEDQTRLRYLELYPYFMENYFKGISISQQFMNSVYFNLSKGKLKDFQPNQFTGWASSYLNISEWYHEKLTEAIKLSLTSTVLLPFSGYSDIKYPEEWIMMKIYAQHIKDLTYLPNYTLAKTLANTLKV